MVQLTGQTYTVSIQYTGLNGELTFDSSNRDLILHDGATPGGVRFLNVDNADQRYQAQSDELEGLKTFEPQIRGFLVRRGPGDYRIRELLVNGDQLAIEFPKGYEGNPTISFKEEIESNHIWNGTQTFTAIVEAEAGVRGNVTGNLAGDTAGKHTGSVDVTGATLTLDPGQLQIEWLEQIILQRLCPIGSILLWSGATGAIPAGWFLCNGANGTPDLRNRFVVGAGGLLAVGETGGDDPIQLEITVENDGAHTHSTAGGAVSTATTGITLNKTIIRPEYEQRQVDVIGNVTLTDPGHTHELDDLEINSGGSHNHTATVPEFEAIPPFYALCYIMKGA